jgi:cell division protein FtsW
MGTRNIYQGLTHSILPAFIILALLGLLMVGSASIAVGGQLHHNPLYFLYRHGIHLGLASIISCICIFHKTENIQKYARTFFLITLFASILIYIPHLGHSSKGSTRWLNLGFSFIQISELVKISSILYLADFLDRQRLKPNLPLKRFYSPFILLLFQILLILLEPDFGSTVVICSTLLMMLFISNFPLRFFLILCFILGLCSIFLVLYAPYRLQRLISYTNPWATPYGSGYQLTQALMAFGHGGIWGVGLGNSTLKLFYLPEAHTDFIFAVLVEELGLIAGLFTIFLFAWTGYQGFSVAKKSFLNNQFFSAYSAIGLSTSWCLQSLINIGVSMGILPTKGLTLPLLSYGGSSILYAGFWLGIMLNLNRNTSMKKRKSKTTLTSYQLNAT